MHLSRRDARPATDRARRILIVDGRVRSQAVSASASNGRATDVRPAIGATPSFASRGLPCAVCRARSGRIGAKRSGSSLGGAVYFPVLEPVGAVAAEIVSSSALDGSFQAYTLFLLAIEAARHSIDITNPYFVDRTMTADILAAVRRGVRVRVLVPAVSDHPWVREASRREFGPMLRAGVEIFEYLRPGPPLRAARDLRNVASPRPHDPGAGNPDPAHPLAAVSAPHGERPRAPAPSDMSHQQRTSQERADA
jgi:PLD-like domain